MRVIKDEVATLKRKRRVTVELDHGEYLMAFNDDRLYRLGGQVEDIVGGYVITESRRVHWCSIEQRWVDV
jgi:hypothetical protein